MKKPIISGALICMTIFVILGGPSPAAIILGAIIGATAGSAVYSFKASNEIRKRRKLVYTLESTLSPEILKDRIRSNLKHHTLKDVKIESENTVSIYTNIGMYELKLDGTNLRIIEYPILSKAILYKLLFRGAPQIILNNEAKLLVPAIYNALK
ncbi:hypothetical protein [Anaerosolibacter sp.]|uniref:hypothetical protein n=1 Tax=Anaerosolibacter sp. TaxID=1872527 RepID=UPI0039EDF0D5